MLHESGLATQIPAPAGRYCSMSRWRPSYFTNCAAFRLRPLTLNIDLGPWTFDLGPFCCKTNTDKSSGMTSYNTTRLALIDSIGAGLHSQNATPPDDWRPVGKSRLPCHERTVVTEPGKARSVDGNLPHWTSQSGGVVDLRRLDLLRRYRKRRVAGVITLLEFLGEQHLGNRLGFSAPI